MTSFELSNCVSKNESKPSSSVQSENQNDVRTHAINMKGQYFLPFKHFRLQIWKPCKVKNVDVITLICTVIISRLSPAHLNDGLVILFEKNQKCFVYDSFDFYCTGVD